MFVLSTHITIGDLEFTFVNNVEVVSSWEMLTDTAKITLPANIKVNRDKLRTMIAPGDKVTIKTGYDNNLNELFSGYVTSISPSTPIEIGCEDEMWKLKQSTVTDSIKNCDVQTLVDKHFSDYPCVIINSQLGNFYIDKISKAKILEQLKKEYGLYSFFRSGFLHIGSVHDSQNARRVKFRFQKNIINDELKYQRKEDVKLQVHAVSNFSDGKRIEVDLGDTEGDKRTLHFFEMTKDELTAAATREFDRLKFDGLRGSFEAFGEPFIRQGDIAQLSHPEDSDLSGDYYVDKVTYTHGVGGSRQKIELGKSAK